ncbi:MAG: NADH-dependent peroxiredoxin subunit, partial [Patescibacteria group bacterium]|nr:NADH-dependent peroxiredoxin subunit [Patescibacteria group bacterium]
VTAVLDAKLESIEGDAFVSGLTYLNKEGEKVSLPVTGIFVEIGLIPTTDFAKDVVERNEIGQIVIDPWTQATSVPGIWAAGDCTNVRYHQNNIASGDGVRALEDLYMHLKTRA